MGIYGIVLILYYHRHRHTSVVVVIVFGTCCDILHFNILTGSYDFPMSLCEGHNLICANKGRGRISRRRKPETRNLPAVAIQVRD